MRVLFISRKYPPAVGGMETQAFGLLSAFPGEKETILLGRSQLHLFWFIPYALVRGLVLGRRCDLIHLCDGLLAPVGLVLKLLLRKPVTVTVHGLDVVYPNWIFQTVNVRCLRCLDFFMPVSQSTGDEMLRRGFSAEKMRVIPNGVDPHRLPPSLSRSYFEEWIRPEHRRVMMTVGRLVKRKGVVWFIENVLYRLPDDVLYLVVGEGSERKAIEQAIARHCIEHRVKLLGRVSDEKLATLYHFADVFVMPNIVVPGDREGFGLVPLEAAVSGLPVVASRVEGIPDAIHDGQNGFLVAEKDASAFVDRILFILHHSEPQVLKEQVKEYSLAHCTWKRHIRQYEEVFDRLLLR